MSHQLSRNGIAGILLLGAFSAGSLAAQGQQPADNVTSDQAISCIKTAIASHPGRVEGLDIEIKAGKVLCEVEIVGEDGRKRELHVDVSSNQVVASKPD